MTHVQPEWIKKRLQEHWRSSWAGGGNRGAVWSVEKAQPPNHKEMFLLELFNNYASESYLIVNFSLFICLFFCPLADGQWFQTSRAERHQPVTDFEDKAAQKNKTKSRYISQVWAFSQLHYSNMAISVCISSRSGAVFSACNDIQRHSMPLIKWCSILLHIEHCSVQLCLLLQRSVR